MSKPFKYTIVLFLLVFTSFTMVPDSYGQKRKKKDQSHAAEMYFSEGMKFYILEEYGEAKTNFEKSRNYAPDNAAVHFMLARVMLGQNRYPEAFAYAKKAVKLDEKNQYYHLLLAGIYEFQGDLTEAAKIYDRLITLFPDVEENYEDLASNYIHQGKYEDAIKVFNRVDAVFGKSPEVSRQKQLLFEKLGKLDAAIKEGEELINTYPEDNAIKIFHSDILIRNKKFDEAIMLLENLLKEEPGNASALVQTAKLYLARNQPEKAFRAMDNVFSNPDVDFQEKLAMLQNLKMHGASKEQLAGLGNKLVEVHPDEPLAYISMGEFLLNINEKKKAWQVFLKAKELQEVNYGFWNQLIILDSELNELDSMLLHSEQALELYPNQAALWYLNGSAFLMKKDFESAATSLEQGKKLASNNTQLLLQFYILLADSYNNLKDYEKSDHAFDEALKIEPNNPHVLNNYSYYLSLRNERLDKALEMMDKLMVGDQKNAAYLDTYAWVLYRLGRFEESKKYLELALDSIEDGTIVEHYGDVLFKLGEKEKAVEQWKRAKKLGQTSSLIDKKISDKEIYE